MNNRRSGPRTGAQDLVAYQLTPEQCRAARGLLDMTRNQLAVEAHVSLATLLQFENHERMIKLSTQALIRMALEASGVQFIPEGEGGVGVRFRQRGARQAGDAGDEDGDPDSEPGRMLPSPGQEHQRPTFR